MEDNQVHKDSQVRGEILVSLEFLAPVLTAVVVKMEYLVFLEVRASPERCWGPSLDHLEATASQEHPETRACLGTLEDPEHLVWTVALEYPV